MSSPTRARTWLAAFGVQAALAVWVFAGPLFEGRVLYFRDISIYYFPNYVFVERALREGVWPLWNYTSDFGAPFLLADPLDLALLAGPGAAWSMRLLPPLYLWIGMVGVTALARRLGQSLGSACAAGLLYGASGLVLSSVNLFEYFHGLSWAPLVVAAFLALWDAPSGRRVAIFAGLAAALMATLSLEIMLQTALVGLVLIPRWGPPWAAARRLGVVLGAGLLASLLAAPVLAGVVTLLSGSARAEGFSHDASFAWSAAPAVLLEAAVPHLFGNPHTFGQMGFWGQPFFATDLPYLLSLYLGPVALGLALLAGRRSARLWVLVVVSILLCMGDRGPLGPLMELWMGSIRVPVKLAWTANLALCLLAGIGLDRLRLRPSGRLAAGLLFVGGVLAVAALVCFAWPEAIRGALSAAVPALGAPRAAPVVASQWPASFAFTGVLTLAASVAALRGRAVVPLIIALGILDLLVTNERINVSAPAEFYELRAPLAEAVEEARTAGRFRWFSYGLSPGIAAAPELVARDSDMWLYYLDRQALLPRTPVLDELESAFDLDRVGWAPRGSTLGVDEKDPSRFGEHYAQLRLANVRWIVSRESLPAELVDERAVLPVPELQGNLHLSELHAPIPRAFWVPRAQRFPDVERLLQRRDAAGLDPLAAVLLEEPPPAAAAPEGRAGQVVYERLGPHSVRLRLSGDAGWVAVLDNYHPYWRAVGPDGPQRVYRAYGGFQALATPGGAREVLLEYRPPWLAPSLAGAGIAALLTLGLVLVPASARLGQGRTKR